MISTAKLIFVGQEFKEYANQDGTKKTYHYGFFMQDDEMQIDKITLIEPLKVKKYDEVNLKIKTEFASFKKQDGTYKNYLRISQVA